MEYALRLGGDGCLGRGAAVLCESGSGDAAGEAVPLLRCGGSYFVKKKRPRRDAGAWKSDEIGISSNEGLATTANAGETSKAEERGRAWGGDDVGDD